MKIHGIIPPVATPMQANEDLDLPRLRWPLDNLSSVSVCGVRQGSLWRQTRQMVTRSHPDRAPRNRRVVTVRGT
jgi:hypothetical protein